MAADIEEIMEANAELLLDRINQLKVTEPGSAEEESITKAYDTIFKNHISLMKANEEALKNDNDEHIATEKLKTEKEINTSRIEVEKKKIDLEEELSKEKYESESRLEKLKVIAQWGGVVAAISTPIVCEVLKQSMHWAVSKKVLQFEETGSITSTVGKAEFRK